VSRIASLPVTDNAMWRKLLAKVHPDAGGEHELFIWTSSVKDHVAGVGIEPRQPSYTGQPRGHYTGQSSNNRAGAYERDDVDRVPFSSHVPFDALTRRALELVDEVDGIFAYPLLLLQDCYEMFSTQMERNQERGASYKQLAAIGHKLGFTKPQRVRWYRIAESVPLSDRHAGHILGRIDD
jgi:hypothetical protein